MAKLKAGQIALGTVVAGVAAGVLGILPGGLQATFNSLKSGFTTSAGAQPIQGLGPTLQPRVGGCNADFIPGVRFVARSGPSSFIVVIDSKIVYTSQSQNDAEQRYNAIVCGGGH